eukprot:657608-Prymnesium_polylepis.1
MQLVAARLHAWAAQPGKVAVMREPAAEHFPQGDYRPGDERRVSSCVPYDRTNEAGDWNRRAGAQLWRAVADLPCAPHLTRTEARGPNDPGRARRAVLYHTLDGRCGAQETCANTHPTLLGCDHPALQHARPQQLQRLGTGHARHARALRDDRLPPLADRAGGVAGGSRDVEDAHGAECKVQAPPCFGHAGLNVFYETRRLKREAAEWARRSAPA